MHKVFIDSKLTVYLYCMQNSNKQMIYILMYIRAYTYSEIQRNNIISAYYLGVLSSIEANNFSIFSRFTTSSACFIFELL